MLGQGKNAWQAEIDAAAEVRYKRAHHRVRWLTLPDAQLADFFRFGAQQVEQLYSQQPPENAPGVWKCVTFVLAVRKRGS